VKTPPNNPKVYFDEPLPHPHAEQEIPGGAPSIKRLDGEVKKLGHIPFAGGIHCEIWKGQWERRGRTRSSGGGEDTGEGRGRPELVALKAFRTLRAPEKTYKRLEHEMYTWAELHHNNVQPLFGTVYFERRLYMVLPWQENGDLLAYVKKNSGTNKNRLVGNIANYVKR